ncbi:vitamin B12 ABC transporter permease BtuC [Saliphagus infecundisoli]|uniref:Cobalamin import system permease protein BtuC n=1 Tax=Saliphagus infecundisoli TaxID=1849069 RepID=A0ABD5QAK9_9EURY|nr:vitamin B12 ABC transporter permease BtuC [Saliphagus infecundisoli]
MERTGRIVSWSAGLTAILAVVVVASAGLGPARIGPTTVALAVLNAVAVPTGAGLGERALPLLGWSLPAPSLEFVRPFAFDVRSSHQTIVADIRLPRIALAATVGFGLAAAGTVMQGFFRNPLADPSIIGVSTGAAAGAVAVIAFPALLPVGLQPAAFAGALATAFLVYAIATEGGRTPVATLLLAGVAVQAFLGALISYMLVHSGDSLREAMIWLMGRLSNATWSDVSVSLPVVLIGVAVLAAFTREMNVLLLGEEDAHHLGIDVERTKLLLLALASVVTAAGVAVAGVIGFVGLVVPHVMRLLVGPDHRILLPTSALAGASFLVATDTLARAGPAEVPVGIVTAAFGAPFFLYLLTKREVHAL